MAGEVEPVIALGQALSVVIGTAAATALAPHLVVLISGLAGGIIGLMSWRKCSIGMGAVYVLGMGTMAWLFTDSVSALLASFWPASEDRRFLGSIALLIGAVGHRWHGVGRWAFGLGRELIESAIKSVASK